MENIVEIENFNKYFGKFHVIDDLSFMVGKGEIFAFLGANGSGKTTTIRSLLGIYQADSGKLLINGKKYSQTDASLLGYLPEERGLYIASNVLETLVYFGQIKGLDYKTAQDESLKFLKRVNLEDKANITISKLSSGQQQKIQLGITIINKPKLLILDEPTKGLDPVNQSLLLDILLELNNQGSTIIFSTHQLNEVEKIADRLIMIKDGKRVLYGSLDKIKQEFSNNSIEIAFANEDKEKLQQENSLFTAEIEGHTAKLTPRKNIHSDDILKYLVDNNVHISNYSLGAVSLNDIFIKISNGK